MLDIRTNSKHYYKLRKIYDKGFKNVSNVSIRSDDSVFDSIIMTQTTSGEFVEWMRGYDNVKNFLMYGYNRIIKKCPFSFMRLFNCKAEKCQLYYMHNLTGDCSYRWNAIIRSESIKE